MCLTGISQKTEINPASPCTSGITAPTSTKTDANVHSLSAPDKQLSLELDPQTHYLSGESSLTIADRRELIALFSETKASLNPLSLSDRLTLSLISAGLVKGITPTSVRKRSGVPIPDFVLKLPDGRIAEQQEAGFSFSKGFKP